MYRDAAFTDSITSEVGIIGKSYYTHHIEPSEMIYGVRLRSRVNQATATIQEVEIFGSMFSLYIKLI